MRAFLSIRSRLVTSSFWMRVHASMRIGLSSNDRPIGGRRLWLHQKTMHGDCILSTAHRLIRFLAFEQHRRHSIPVTLCGRNHVCMYACARGFARIRRPTCIGLRTRDDITFRPQIQSRPTRGDPQLEITQPLPYRPKCTLAG